VGSWIKERLDSEEGVVNGAELVAGDDQDVAWQAGDEVTHGVTFAQGDEQATRAFDEEEVSSGEWRVASRGV